jgi:hypothetical protein
MNDVVVKKELRHHRAQLPLDAAADAFIQEQVYCVRRVQKVTDRSSALIKVLKARTES